MTTEDPPRTPAGAGIGQKAQQAYDAADHVYQKLTQPGRPIEPDPSKKPWLAALLAVLLAGLGQLYNRQLGKAVGLFVFTYIIGGLLLLAWALLAWLITYADPDGGVYATGQFFVRMALAVPVVMVGLWLFAIVDAWRTAEALRTGRLVVRYGFRRQAAHMAAGFIPGAGVVIPEETVAPDEANRSLGQTLKDEAVKRVIKKLTKRFVKIGFLLLAGVPLLLGAYLEWPVVVVLGALVVLVALVSMLG